MGCRFGKTGLIEPQEKLEKGTSKCQINQRLT